MKEEDIKIGDWIVITESQCADPVGTVVKVVEKNNVTLKYHSIINKGVKYSCDFYRKALPHEIPTSDKPEEPILEKGKYYQCKYGNYDKYWYFQYDYTKYGNNELCYSLGHRQQQDETWADYKSSFGYKKEIKELTEVTEQEAKDIKVENVKEPEIDSWCVEVTKNNQEVVKKWVFGTDWPCTIGAYYGIGLSGNKTACSNYQMSSYFTRCIHTEEFYQKIGHKPEVAKESDKWIVGGWVKCIDSTRYSRDQFYKDKYYQIEQGADPRSTVIKFTSETGIKLVLVKDIDIIWIGMTKPESSITWTNSIPNSKELPKKDIAIEVFNQEEVDILKGYFENLGVKIWNHQGIKLYNKTFFIVDRSNCWTTAHDCGVKVVDFNYLGLQRPIKEEMFTFTMPYKVYPHISQPKTIQNNEQSLTIIKKVKPQKFNEFEYQNKDFNKKLVLSKPIKLTKQLIKF